MAVTESTTFTQEGTDASQTGTRGFKLTMKSNARVLVSALKVAGTTFPNCYLCSSTDAAGLSPLATATFSGNVATFSPQPMLSASTTYYIVVQASSGATVSYDNTFSYPVSGTHLDFVAATNGVIDATNNGWAIVSIDTDSTDKTVVVSTLSMTSAAVAATPTVTIAVSTLSMTAVAPAVSVDVAIDRNAGTQGTAVVRDPSNAYGGRYGEYRRSDDRYAPENKFFKTVNG